MQLNLLQQQKKMFCFLDFHKNLFNFSFLLHSGRTISGATVKMFRGILIDSVRVAYFIQYSHHNSLKLENL